MTLEELESCLERLLLLELSLALRPLFVLDTLLYRTLKLPRLLRPPIDPRQWRRCGWPRVAQLLGRSACRPLLGLLQLQRQSSIARLGFSARVGLSARLDCSDGACWLVGRMQWRSAPSRIEVSGHLVDRPRAHGIREGHVLRKELRLDVQELSPAQLASRHRLPWVRGARRSCE